MIDVAHSESRGHQFGTFGGVFTPSLLTILGVVLFMSAGHVIGYAGILSAVLILFIAQSITFLTGLSIAAISTNTPVKGGGAYYLISRSLGPESGGAIGLTLYFAQALSVPFYILGFTEAVVVAFPSLNPYFSSLTLLTATVLLGVNLFGASWAIRVQYIILAVLSLSIILFICGALTHFEWSTFEDNLYPRYNDIGDQKTSFWSMFAIYFPAVTGVMTGVNMSGDLKNPALSIPRGTFYAIGVGFCIYLIEIIICGGAQTRDQLTFSFHETLLDHSLFGLTALVIVGVFAASLSSALGSLLGAPRILQALSRDSIFPILRPFAEGRSHTDEPIRGLLFTSALTYAVLGYSAYIGSGGGGEALNSVGAILTMFFLYAYGMTNIAAFAESFTKNPSFRPRFRFFHWFTALIGALGCFFTAFLIHWEIALLACFILLTISYYIKRRVLSSTYGDVRRGFYYARVRENLLKLNSHPPHPKNWRPNTVILSGNPNSRLTLTKYALWLENNRGVATLVELLIGPLQEQIQERPKALRRLATFIEEHRLQAFHEVLVAENFDQGLLSLLQCHSIGPLRPNLVMLGWPSDQQRFQGFSKLLRLIKYIGLNMVIAVDRGLPSETDPKRIDIWWRGRDNGSLMLILGYLLSNNIEWSRYPVRVLRAVDHEREYGEATEEIHQLLDEARINGEAQVVLKEGTIHRTLLTHSHDASVMFLGMTPTDQREADASFCQRYESLLEGLPTTLLISSVGDADLLS